MSGDDVVRETVRRYVETFGAGDRDGWLALFGDGATLEDPVGSAPCRGRDEIGAFWDRSREAVGRISLRLVQGPNVCGDRAAFAMEAVAEVGGATMTIPTIDVMTFDEAGRITTQQAYWNPADVRTG